MAGEAFGKSVFINCPFDKDYEPILQAILFCVVYLGFEPRTATESNDSGSIRLNKICDIIENSKYSVHDLSRCQAKKKGEHFRLNMPFELGVDYGCRQYFGQGREGKRLLILEEKCTVTKRRYPIFPGVTFKLMQAIFRTPSGRLETGS